MEIVGVSEMYNSFAKNLMTENSPLNTLQNHLRRTPHRNNSGALLCNGKSNFRQRIKMTELRFSVVGT
jgi:hypothetical protein